MLTSELKACEFPLRYALVFWQITEISAFSSPFTRKKSSPPIVLLQTISDEMHDKKRYNIDSNIVRK